MDSDKPTADDEGEHGTSDDKPTPHRKTLSTEEIAAIQLISRLLSRSVTVLAAAVAVIAASCLSGLPSASCYTLEDAYISSLYTLIIVLLCIAFVFVAISTVDFYFENNTKTSLVSGGAAFSILVFCGIVISFAGYVSWIGLIEGAANVKIAVDYCNTGFDLQGQKNLHTRTRLHRNPLWFDQLSALKSIRHDVS